MSNTETFRLLEKAMEKIAHDFKDGNDKTAFIGFGMVYQVIISQRVKAEAEENGKQ